MNYNDAIHSCCLSHVCWSHRVSFTQQLKDNPLKPLVVAPMCFLWLFLVYEDL